MKNSKNVFKLKPEDKLILSCGHSQVSDELEKKIMKLINLDLDWEYIVDMATRHRLRPLIYYNLNNICPDNVPEDVLVSLRDFYHSNVRKNLMMTGELVNVMKLLEENGINAVTYKGPVLAQMAYGNIGLREFGDLDILVDKSEALKAKEIMILNGYRLLESISIKDSRYLKLHSEFAFMTTNKSIIEINWKFEGMLFSFPENPVLLFKKLKKTEINCFEFNTFTSVNQILILTIHNAKHNWTRISWLCDISELINNKNIDWKDLINKSEQFGIKRILMINLFLIRELFGLIIPKDVLNQLNDPSVINISQQILKWIFIDHKESLNISEITFLYIKRREKYKDKIKEYVNIILRPVYGDLEHICLPDILFPIYYIIRPSLLMKRYINWLIESKLK